MLELVYYEFGRKPSEEFQTVLVEKMKDVELPFLKIREGEEVEGRLFDLAERDFVLPFLCSDGLLLEGVKLKADLAFCSLEGAEQRGINLL